MNTSESDNMEQDTPPPDRSHRKRLRLHAITQVVRQFSHHLREHKRTISFAVVCMLAVTVTELIRPWPMKVIFDGVLIPVVNGQSESVVATIFDIALSPSALAALAAFAIVTIAVLNGVFTYWHTWFTQRVAQGVTASIRREIYGHLQRLSRSFHDERQTGDLMVRLTGDARLVQDMMVTTAMLLADRLLVVVCMIVIMFWLDWQLTCVAIAVLPVLLGVLTFYLRLIKVAAKKQRKRESQIASEMTEKLSAITVIQAFARESHENQQFDVHNDNSVRASLVSTRLSAQLSRTVQITIACGVGLVMWMGVQRVIAGFLTPGDLLVFVAYMKGLYKPLRKLATMASRLIKATVSGERLIDILDTQPAIRDVPNAINATNVRGDIRFDAVEFSYANAVPVLSNAQFHIKAGEHIALLGESGSGKSTIVSLLLRLYDPTKGVICVDGHDLRTFTVQSWRDQVALVLQESTLFRATIADNIAYGRLDASNNDIQEAAGRANAHGFISRLPDGYDTVLSERGDTLSGGQRQRIAIARAIIRNAPVVVLDEPVSGLDQENRQQVEAALRQLTQDRTCITITHDPAIALVCDRVLQVVDGQVTELSCPDLANTTVPANLQRLAAIHS